MNKNWMKTLAAGMATLMLAGSLVGCGSNDQGNTDTALKGTISLAGSTSMEKLCEAMSESFMETYPDITVTVEYTGSGAGIESLTAGSIGIGNASRSLKDGEKENGAVENVAAIDGIAVIVDKENAVADLTTQQLADIYTSNVTNWSELGGNDEAIVVIGRENGSGTRGAFEELLEIEDTCKYAQELDYTGGVLAIFAVCSITVYMIAKGTPALKEVGVLQLLFGTVWSPTASTASYGIAYIILSSIVGTACSILIGVPIALLTAVFLTEIANKTLSGIPSIIFGLFGMMFFGQTLKMGYSLMTGAFTLILMVLPLITRNTQEALKTVPNSYRHGSVGLGAGKWYTIRTILLPSAMPGIITGVILAIGRIVGESAALLFTAGSAKALPKTISALSLFGKLFQSGGTMTIQLYLSATSEGDFDTAFGIAVVLLVIVFLINLGTKRLAARFDVTRRK